MKKRLIFDLDNTLMLWKDEYILKTKEVVLKYNLNIDYKLVDKVIDDFENNTTKYTREELINVFNNTLNVNVDQKFLQDIFDAQKTLAEIDDKLIDLLEYLASKYELVVLTNYFTEVQVGRLETAKILKYFNEVIGGDLVDEVKPAASAFYKAMGNFKPSECIMIGDSYRCDIMGAKNVGIDTIFIDTRLQKPDYDGLKINEIYELREML